jgi:hypothetical protein
VTGQWVVSLGTLVSFINYTDHSDIAEILLKVVLNPMSEYKNSQVFVYGLRQGSVVLYLFIFVRLFKFMAVGRDGEAMDRVQRHVEVERNTKNGNINKAKYLKNCLLSDCPPPDNLFFMYK